MNPLKRLHFEMLQSQECNLLSAYKVTAQSLGQFTVRPKQLRNILSISNQEEV